MTSHFITVDKNTYEYLQQELIELRQVIADLKQGKLSTAPKQSPEQMRLFVEYTPAAIAMCDRQMRYLLASRRWREDYGLGDQDIIGRSHDEIFLQVPQRWLEIYQCCLAGAVKKCEEDTFTRADGKTEWVKWEIHPWYEDSGEVGGLIMFTEVITARITERKQAEEALKASQHFIQRIADFSPNTIYIYDLEQQRNVYANHEIAKLLGYSTEEIQQMDSEILPTIIHPDDREKVLNHHQKFLTAKDGEIFEIEYQVRQADGQWRWLYSRDTPFSRSAGSIKQILGVSTDITDRKRSEIQLQQQAQDLENTLRQLQHSQALLIQSEKMSSLGNMVAGVAHEINNPVNFIHGNLIPASEYTQDLLRLVELYQKYYLDPPEEIQAEIEAIDLDFLKEDLVKLLQSMLVGTRRIREIVLSLRNFSRLDEAEFKQVDIHEGIDSSLMILHNRLNAKPDHPEILVIKEYGKLPPIECYPSQLNQVFMNILANAMDALEESFVIRHTIGKAAPQGSRSFVEDKGHRTYPEIRIRTEVVDGNRVAIRIADNGSGIPQEIHSKLFDPFFTTKDVGKGTGLGLSISYQIVVEKHGGELSFHSTPGLGAEFLIEIPITLTLKKNTGVRSQESESISRGFNPPLIVDR